MLAAMTRKRPLNAGMLNPEGMVASRAFVAPGPAPDGVKAYPWAVSARPMVGGFLLVRRLGEFGARGGRYQYLLCEDGTRFVCGSEADAKALASWLNATS